MDRLVLIPINTYVVVTSWGSLVHKTIRFYKQEGGGFVQLSKPSHSQRILYCTNTSLVCFSIPLRAGMQVSPTFPSLYGHLSGIKCCLHAPRLGIIQVSTKIFEKAVGEPQNSTMYADLVQLLHITQQRLTREVRATGRPAAAASIRYVSCHGGWLVS